MSACPVLSFQGREREVRPRYGTVQERYSLPSHAIYCADMEIGNDDAGKCSATLHTAHCTLHTTECTGQFVSAPVLPKLPVALYSSGTLPVGNRQVATLSQQQQLQQQ